MQTALERRTSAGTLSHLWPLSLDALLRFRLRTALSILGIVIGVAAFIAMLSVSEGGRRAALRQVDRLGLRNLVVHDLGAGTGRAGLRAEDAVRLPRLVPAVARAAAVESRHSRVSGPAGATDAPALGVTADYLALRQQAAARGRLLTPLDDGARQVCVIGAGLTRRLFAGRDPVGDQVGVNGRWLTVVGVLDTTPAEATDDQAVRAADHDGAVLMPLAVLFGSRELLPGRAVGQVWLQAAPDAEPLRVKAAVERALAGLHGDAPFRVTAAQELLAQRLQTQRIFNVVVGSVAVLTLLVGGIGIMNILLASVLERTQEIGLRRTVGATRTSIRLQFVLESVAMTVTGGVVGLAAGAVVAAGVTAYAGWPTYVSVGAALVALGTASLVGVAFGIYPAVRAARLQPIDAVRWE
jgi:putative ABC transport system permease protein